MRIFLLLEGVRLAVRTLSVLIGSKMPPAGVGRESNPASNKTGFGSTGSATCSLWDKLLDLSEPQCPYLNMGWAYGPWSNAVPKETMYVTCPEGAQHAGNVTVVGRLR